MENKKIAQATHNIYAYRITKSSTFLQVSSFISDIFIDVKLAHAFRRQNIVSKKLF